MENAKKIAQFRLKTHPNWKFARAIFAVHYISQHAMTSQTTLPVWYLHTRQPPNIYVAVH